MYSHFFASFRRQLHWQGRRISQAACLPWRLTTKHFSRSADCCRLRWPADLCARRDKDERCCSLYLSNLGRCGAVCRVFCIFSCEMKLLRMVTNRPIASRKTTDLFLLDRWFAHVSWESTSTPAHRRGQRVSHSTRRCTFRLTRSLSD